MTESESTRRIKQLEAAVESAYAEASEQNVQILGLLEMAIMLNDTRSVDGILEVLSTPCRTQAGSGAKLWWVSDNHQGSEMMITLAAQWRGDEPATATDEPVWQLLEPPFVRLLMDEPDAPTLISDVTSSLTFGAEEKAFLHDQGVRALAFLPLVQLGKLRAILSFEWSEPHEFTDRDNPYHASLSAIASGAVTSHRLVETMEQTIEERTRELQDKLDVITRQQEAIRALSSPILEVWNDILVVPIIGKIDENRRVLIMESLLGAIVERQSRYVILDVTGVEAVEADMAEQLVQVTHASTLLGAMCVLTGIHPTVARALVEIGANFEQLKTFRSLRDGLRHCLRDRNEGLRVATPPTRKR